MQNKDEILQKIVIIFRKELEDENLEVLRESSSRSVEKWDSITNLMLISSIEEKFNIVFPIDFIFKAENVGDLCDYIFEHQTAVN